MVGLDPTGRIVSGDHGDGHGGPSASQESGRKRAAYTRAQEAVAEVSASVPAETVLDLGSGTGETLAAVLRRHPGARAVGLDASADRLAAARIQLRGLDVDLRVGQFSDALPAGPFDVVVSAFAMHHLTGPEKAALFARVAGVLRPGGRFVVGDVVVPDDPADAVTAVAPDHGGLSSLAELLGWLEDARLDAGLAWQERDLVVLRADKAA
ncbi:MAG TPA: class I SAM-dependent methyltransferase [Acidimicrobiales bacterium]|nr:class I SAM-dependent methyltransferase [Acidimicrobiales bacterium]